MSELKTLIIEETQHDDCKNKQPKILLKASFRLIYAYRVGSGCFHVLKLDNQLEITITDGKIDIPDQENCLDYLRVGHIQIGVLDSMDVTYTIAYILNILKAQNDDLTYSYLKH